MREQDSTVKGAAMKFRKKPVEVEARQFDGRIRLHDPVAEWIEENGGKVAYFPGAQELRITTLEGEMIASAGDWIIQGVQGEFYPCKPDIFQATYEQVEA